MCLITISANSFICDGLSVLNISTKYSIIWKKENNCLLLKHYKLGMAWTPKMDRRKAHALVNARELGFYLVHVEDKYPARFESKGARLEKAGSGLNITSLCNIKLKSGID